MLNPFFKNVGPFDIKKLLTNAKIENKENFQKDKIYNVSDLVTATNKDLTFFHSKNYSSLASKTKASYCLTSENFQSLLPDNCKPIITNKVLLHTAQITKIFYPDSITDNYDGTVKDINETKFKDKVKFSLKGGFKLTFEDKFREKMI